ncbi:hypothetical protein BD289DRAFT_4089 [Coniella lustricola]|uniref:Secreted protein n=1 Tax=Coniella lustricola TaxID=2025994 RepID=A0A2T3ANN9_9PEZI|nr:hypothetical protein BD289DRAFT_4089 [Coniella lustricola]
MRIVSALVGLGLHLVGAHFSLPFSIRGSANEFDGMLHSLDRLDRLDRLDSLGQQTCHRVWCYRERCRVSRGFFLGIISIDRTPFQAVRLLCYLWSTIRPATNPQVRPCYSGGLFLWSNCVVATQISRDGLIKSRKMGQPGTTATIQIGQSGTSVKGNED